MAWYNEDIGNKRKPIKKPLSWQTTVGDTAATANLAVSYEA